jgi:aspartate aminotransferase
MIKMYADRVKSLETSGIRKMFEGAGKNSINLGLGQPDFDTPPHIKEAAIRAIQEGKTGYTLNAGIDDLRSAISQKLRKENGLDCVPDQIIVTAGASEALHIVLQALVERGDRVLFADPGFVSYAALTTIAEGHPVGIPLDPQFHLDIEKAKEAMDGARILILNSPSNPTGAMEGEESIRALVEYAMEAGVTVVSDEVYEHFVYEKRHVSPARFGERVITINAASKTYAMTGWRLGFLAAAKEVVDQCMKVHQYCQACATSISQYAALAAYTGTQAPVQEMRKEYLARRDLVYHGLSSLGFTFPRPEGAFYAFIPMDTRLLTRILEKGVVLVPGTAFGKNAPGHARLSYAASQENLRSALHRIAEARREVHG